ncbi:damage-control phosphatase ARMT1 family protein [Wenjunlia tyrosinilytica]|uniref:damage-control phosphatase ARMT1 family protein n=1 Tax=Wenjunlia tyrosinilytica TaxID=1544741 RepID=UPI0027E42339|nr:damage-control phosphatase ARMT1 family protein [Wenjunlia tyrosinilytica]
MILSNLPGSFAHGVLEKRHPALIQQVRSAYPYSPQQRRALDNLLEEITDGSITPLDTNAFDHEAWAAWGSDYFGRSWLDVPFLWAESFFYRKLLAATSYFETGPWQGIDPFAPAKRAELHSSVVDEELRALDALPSRSAPEQAEMLLQSSLWGNRADLGFRIENAAPGAIATNLVVDDSTSLWSRLTEVTPGTVAVVADNSGRELIPDLVLIDHLLQRGYAAAAVLHVKPYPYYVSDATMSDVIDSLRRLVHAPGQAGEIGRRLWDAMGTGRLDVRSHPFFCAPLPYSAMPEDLRDEFGASSVTIVKGDLNYRRLVGDRHWDATTPYEDLTGYFPSPVAALRTLKSDVIVGLSQQQLVTLEASNQEWRTSGTHALVQAPEVTR